MTAARPEDGRWGSLDRPPLRVDALRRALVAPAGPLSRFELVEQTGSTNADLMDAVIGSDSGTGGAANAWPHLSVLVADHQAAGRGRLGRTWETPPRSAVTFSLLLRPDPVPLTSWSWVPLLAGLAVVRTLRSTAGVQAGLKWPNDVLVGAMPDARKVAGILAEVATSTPPALVLGVGLNVTTTEGDLPVPTATSLRIEGSATTDRDTMLRALLRELAAVLTRWQEAGGDVVGSGLAAEVREVCLTLGRPVRVELPGGEPLVGVAEELADDGRLVVRTPDGAVPVPAGDVVHLRDAQHLHDGRAAGDADDGR